MATPKTTAEKVDARTQDAKVTNTFVHKLLVQLNPDTKEFHEAQHNAVRTQALQQGLKPTGLVEYKGDEPDGHGSFFLTYEVEVVPADEAKGADALAPADESLVK